MEPRDHLRTYVKRKGGTTAAAASIGIPTATLYGVLNGWRGVSRRQATEWSVSSGGELSAEQLIWIRPTKKPADRAA